MRFPKTAVRVKKPCSISFVIFILLASTIAVAQEASETLKVSASSMRKVTEGIVYAGAPLRGVPARLSRQVVTIGTFAYYAGSIACGLVKEDTQSGVKVCLNLRDLAAKAGWSENTRLFSNPYGLFRQGESLWMGTNAVGILVYDTRSGLWMRYDVKTGSIAGDISAVVWADDDYVFVAVGGPRQEIPDRKPSLDVYSIRRQRWLQIDAIPTKDALALGRTSGLTAQIFLDDRIYLGQPYIPLGEARPVSKSHPSEVTRSDAGYVLRYDYSGGDKTELLVRRVLLERAFDR